MNNMFYAYDNNIDLESSCSASIGINDCLEGQKMIFNKANKFVGVQVRHKAPFNLYFNLSACCSQQDLTEFIANSLVNVKINALSHKTIVEKTVAGYEVFDPRTCDLCIAFDAAESSKLLQESYRLEVNLLHEADSYLIFNEIDIYLIVR